jgi:cereblon
VDEAAEEDSDAEDGAFDGERTGDLDGNESEDLIAALNEEDEQDSSDEDDDGTDSYDERPRVRQRSNTGSSVGRRLEALSSEPTEGRNRKRRELPEARLSTEGYRPEEVQSAAARGNTEEAVHEEHPAQSRDDYLARIVPVSSVRAQGGPYAKAYQMWRKDASRWKMRAQLTAWPHWVYRQYDPFDLARRAADILGQMGDHPRLEELVSRPTALSYYIGSNMPIQDHTRQELLEIDSTLARLKREIQLLEGMDTLRCNCCGEVIARRSDVFVMSTEGAIGAYVNAHGYVHETLTLSCARNMRIRGAPQTENSWFPGYAWILAKCQGCHLNRREQHMGWRFIAVDPDTRPQTFWGIRRTQLIGSSETEPPDYWD